VKRKMDETHVKHCKVCKMKTPAVLDLTCRALEGFSYAEIQQTYPEWLSLSKASISRHMAAVFTPEGMSRAKTLPFPEDSQEITELMEALEAAGRPQ
jgi:hypothetical protein